MDVLSSIDWTFLEEFLGAHGKIIAAVIALFVGVISLAVAIFKHWHGQTLERILSRVANNIEKKDAALQQAAARLKDQEAEIEKREKRLKDVREGFVGKEHDLWCMHAPRRPDDYDGWM